MFVEVYTNSVMVKCSNSDKGKLINHELNSEYPTCESFFAICEPENLEDTPLAAEVDDVPDELVDVRVKMPLTGSTSSKGDAISIQCTDPNTRHRVHFKLRGTVVDRIKDPFSVRQVCEELFAKQNVPAPKPILPTTPTYLPPIDEEDESVPAMPEIPISTTTTVSPSAHQHNKAVRPRSPPIRRPPTRRAHVKKIPQEPRIPRIPTPPHRNRHRPAPKRAVRVFIDLDQRKKN